MSFIRYKMRAQSRMFAALITFIYLFIYLLVFFIFLPLAATRLCSDEALLCALRLRSAYGPPPNWSNRRLYLRK